MVVPVLAVASSVEDMAAQKDALEVALLLRQIANLDNYVHCCQYC
jgi:hypothetical protein